MTEYDLRNSVEYLTDHPCSFALQHRARALARAWGPNGPYFVADLIDNSCVYVRFVDSVALMEGSRCPLQDWHDFATEWRGAWEGYG